MERVLFSSRCEEWVITTKEERKVEDELNGKSFFPLWMDAGGWRTCAALIADNISLLASLLLSFLFSRLLISEEKMWLKASLTPTLSFSLLPRSLALSLSFGDIIVLTVMDVQPDNGKHVKKSTSQKLEDQKKVKCCFPLCFCRQGWG